jgi:hypothetical protein
VRVRLRAYWGFAASAPAPRAPTRVLGFRSLRGLIQHFNALGIFMSELDQSVEQLKSAVNDLSNRQALPSPSKPSTSTFPWWLAHHR